MDDRTSLDVKHLHDPPNIIPPLYVCVSACASVSENDSNYSLCMSERGFILCTMDTLRGRLIMCIMEMADECNNAVKSGVS